jgi:hypothetical protein
VVEARLKEEKEAKEALVALEKLDIDSLEFEAPFNALRSAVLRHAETEEHEEFDELAGELSEDQMRRMTKAVQFAEATARPGRIPKSSPPRAICSLRLSSLWSIARGMLSKGDLESPSSSR